MNGAQARIRLLYEQVRALEAEAIRPVRRRRLPRALLVLAAAAIGAASAGSTHPVRHESARAAVAVVHLIDSPANRARALPAPRHRARTLPAPRHRVHVVHHPHRTHVVVLPARPVAHAEIHRRIVVRTHVAPSHATAPAPRAAAAPTHVVAPKAPAAPVAQPHAAPKPRPAAPPVSVGPVVVATGDEPAPADTTSPTAP